jgi:hypothetical protein
MTNRPKVLKVEQLAIRIPIQTLCYSGAWSRVIDNSKIELRHVQDGIILLVNDVQQPVQWQIYERKLCGRLQRGGFIPADKQWVYYLIGRDGRRYRFLYVMGTCIGTRDDFGARYIRNCQSKKQRRIVRQCRLLGLSKRKRERQVALYGQP